MSTQYDGIYFNQSRVSGEVRMSSDGLGWRATQKLTAGSSTKISKPFLLPASELLSSSWSRGAHDYMLQIQTKSGVTVSLDGFEAEQFTALQRSLSSFLDLQLEHREHSLRGWNWGKVELERNEMVMNVASKPNFEIPYNQIASSNVVGKSEVAIELDLPVQADRTTAGDELVEIRYFIPGVADEEDEDGDAVNAAQIFHDQLQDRADIGAASGSELAQLTQVLFITPRGRYDIQFFADAFRLHGKTYDYKVLYNSVQRIFALPRLDEQHNMVVLQLDPPLRQGQTRYPFLVMQFAKEDKIEVELNVEDDDYESNYKEKLERKYDSAAHEVVSSIIKGLSGRKITFAGTFKSIRNFPAVSCLTKAADASLYPLDKAVLLISKAPMYIPYSEIDHVRFSRMATGNRTFDLTFTLRSGISNTNAVVLTGIAKEEQPALEQFFDSKNLSIKNDAIEGRKQRLAELDDNIDDGGSQDEESEDEDFDEENASDEEDSGVDSDDGSGGSDDEDAEISDEDGSDGLDTGDSKVVSKSERKKQKN